MSSRPTFLSFRDTVAEEREDTKSHSIFRDRLRPRKQAVSPMADVTPPRFQAEGLQKDMYQQFIDAFSARSRAEPVFPISRPAKETPQTEVATGLRDTLATAGSDLHTAITEKLVKYYEEVNSDTEKLSSDSLAFLSFMDKLYALVGSPLDSTLCSSAKTKSQTLRVHVSSLKQSLHEAEKELEQLQADYDSCLEKEEEIYRELQRGGNDDDVDKKASEALTKEVEDVGREFAKIVEQLDKDYRQSVQTETMKLMQSMAME